MDTNTHVRAQRILARSLYSHIHKQCAQLYTVHSGKYFLSENSILCIFRPKQNETHMQSLKMHTSTHTHIDSSRPIEPVIAMASTPKINSYGVTPLSVNKLCHKNRWCSLFADKDYLLLFFYCYFCLCVDGADTAISNTNWYRMKLH